MRLISTGSFYNIPITPNNLNLEFVVCNNNLDFAEKLIANNNKIISVHSPWITESRLSAIQKLKIGISAARQLHAKYINFHLPTKTKLEQTKKLCSNSDFKFLAENRYWFHLPEQYTTLRYFLSALDTLDMQSTLDLSHAAACGWDILEAIDKLKAHGRLCCLHFSDALIYNGKVKQHLLPGQGNLPLQEIDYSAFELVVFEVNPSVFRTKPRARTWNLDLLYKTMQAENSMFLREK